MVDRPAPIPVEGEHLLGECQRPRQVALLVGDVGGPCSDAGDPVRVIDRAEDRQGLLVGRGRAGQVVGDAPFVDRVAAVERGQVDERPGEPARQRSRAGTRPGRRSGSGARRRRRPRVSGDAEDERRRWRSPNVVLVAAGEGKRLLAPAPAAKSSSGRTASQAAGQRPRTRWTGEHAGHGERQRPLPVASHSRRSRAK